MNNCNPLLAEVKVLTSKKNHEFQQICIQDITVKQYLCQKWHIMIALLKKTCRFILLGLKVIILVPLFPYLSLANGPRNCLIHNPQSQEWENKKKAYYYKRNSRPSLNSIVDFWSIFRQLQYVKVSIYSIFSRTDMRKINTIYNRLRDRAQFY